MTCYSFMFIYNSLMSYCPYIFSFFIYHMYMPITKNIDCVLVSIRLMNVTKIFIFVLESYVGVGKGVVFHIILQTNSISLLLKKYKLRTTFHIRYIIIPLQHVLISNIYFLKLTTGIQSFNWIGKGILTISIITTIYDYGIVYVHNTCSTSWCVEICNEFELLIISVEFVATS